MVVDSSVVPAISILASPGNVVCAGTADTFTAAITGGGSSPFYQWVVNGSDVDTGATFYTYVPDNNDSIRCILTSNAQCAIPDTVSSNNIHISIIPLPDVGAITGQDTVCIVWFPVTLTDNINGGTWACSNANATILGGVVTGENAGKDTIYYIATNSCGSDSATHIVTITPCPDAVTTLTSPGNEITIYPNPAHTDLTISATDVINTIAISNLVGQAVYSNRYNASEVHVSVANLLAGVYFVKVNGVAVGKFVKE